MQLYGWTGKILRVDLSGRQYSIENLDAGLMENFIGGRGINSMILYNETGPETDPLGPENRLIIGTSPLTGTIVPTACRFTVTAKSPLTGIHGDANSGGAFAPEIKYAGFDFLIIQGASEKPVYLLIRDGNIEIRDAFHIMGKGTHETEQAIRKENSDQDLKVLSIGLAGENLVKIAGIVTGINIAARCGLGAVMGSKKLKAIAVKGTKSVKVADPKKLMDLTRAMYRELMEAEAWGWYPKYGWTAGLEGMAGSGCAPVKNYLLSGGTDFEKRRVFFNVEKSGQFRFKDMACFSCPLACNKLVYSGRFGMKKAPVAGSGHMPIWEVYDYPYHVEINDLCESYGMDIYSVQTAIAAAMEWYEKGIINKVDTGGLDVSFGNREAAVELVHRIARREGIGDILAEGSIRAGKIIGADPDTTPSCGFGKDMDHGPIDCTSMAALTLANCVPNRGAGHLQCTPPMSWGVVTELPAKWKKFYEDRGAGDIVDKPWICHPVIAEIVTYFEKINTSSDVLELCKNISEYYYFYGYAGRDVKDDLQWHTDWINAVTGRGFGRSHIEKAAERVVTLERSYNAREGKRREHDMPSRRFLQKRVGGPLDGRALDEEDLNRLFDEYYKIHGWDPATSIPAKETLIRLGLLKIAEEFEIRGLF